MRILVSLILTTSLFSVDFKKSYHEDKGNCSSNELVKSLDTFVKLTHEYGVANSYLDVCVQSDDKANKMLAKKIKIQIFKMKNPPPIQEYINATKDKQIKQSAQQAFDNLKVLEKTSSRPSIKIFQIYQKFEFILSLKRGKTVRLNKLKALNKKIEQTTWLLKRIQENQTEKK